MALIDFVSLGFKHLKTRKNARKCTNVKPNFKILGGALPDHSLGTCGTRVHFVLYTLQSLPSGACVQYRQDHMQKTANHAQLPVGQ